MFTGIIEDVGKVVRLEEDGSNRHITVSSTLTPELKVDQSIAHNGVCLTIVAVENDEYTVTAINETLNRSNLGMLEPGDRVNLERCTRVGHRLDGHIVQGHVDQTAKCADISQQDGSWLFRFEFEKDPLHIMVDKGSVTINGVSLTVVDALDKSFSVAIIPYTYQHTVFGTMQPGDTVNIEFDIVGKYVEKMLEKRES